MCQNNIRRKGCSVKASIFLWCLGLLISLPILYKLYYIYMAYFVWMIKSPILFKMGSLLVRKRHPEKKPAGFYTPAEITAFSKESSS